MTDLTYFDDGLYARFVPETPQGEQIWRAMHKAGAEIVFSHHLKAVIAQIKAAGYTVRKARKVKDTRAGLDEIYKELME